MLNLRRNDADISKSIFEQLKVVTDTSVMFLNSCKSSKSSEGDILLTEKSSKKNNDSEVPSPSSQTNIDVRSVEESTKENSFEATHEILVSPQDISESRIKIACNDAAEGDSVETYQHDDNIGASTASNDVDESSMPVSSDTERRMESAKHEKKAVSRITNHNYNGLKIKKLISKCRIVKKMHQN
ncbi:Uncharacterised protein g6089 [Pycnogonum litorale]